MISKDQQLEIGAPADVEGAGVDASGVVLRLRRNLDDRQDVEATIGEIPKPSSDRAQSFVRREESRIHLVPADQVDLTGSESTLADWESPTIPGWIWGGAIKDFPGSNITPETIDPNDLADSTITEDLIADNSIGLDELSQALKDFIAASGGGDGSVGFGNLSPALQTIFCKLEAYAEAENVIAADPNPPILLDNIVPDPNFGGGVAWSKSGSGWTLDQSLGEARFESSASGTRGDLTTSIPSLEEGKTYRVSFRFREHVKGAVRAVLGGTEGRFRRFVDVWQEDIVAGSGNALVLEGHTDSSGADLAITDVFAEQVIRQAGMVSRLSDPGAQRAGIQASNDFTGDLDAAVWEVEHPDRWIFDDLAGTATYIGPIGGLSRLRFIVPSTELRQPVSPNMFPREVGAAFEFRILEMLNPRRHVGTAVSTNFAKEFEDFPGGLSVHLPGDIRSVGLGSQNPTHSRSQWFTRTGKFAGVLFWPEPMRFRAGDLIPAMGPNLVDNPEFGSEVAGGGSSGWVTSGNGWILVDTVSGAELGHAHFLSEEGEHRHGYLRTDVELEVGATYRLIYDVIHRTKGSVIPELGQWKGVGSSSEGHFVEDLPFEGGGNYLRFEGISPRRSFSTPNVIEGADIKIDNVYLHKLIFPDAEGDRFVIELWVAAQGLTITNPRFSLFGQRSDPEYLSKATEQGPVADWSPVVAAQE